MRWMVFFLLGVCRIACRCQPRKGEIATRLDLRSAVRNKNIHWPVFCQTMPIPPAAVFRSWLQDLLLTTPPCHLSRLSLTSLRVPCLVLNRFIPCFHSIACHEDATNLLRRRGSCPVCREPIESVEEGEFAQVRGRWSSCFFFFYFSLVLFFSFSFYPESAGAPCHAGHLARTSEPWSPTKSLSLRPPVLVLTRYCLIFFGEKRSRHLSSRRVHAFYAFP